MAFETGETVEKGTHILQSQLLHNGNSIFIPLSEGTEVMSVTRAFSFYVK